MKKISLLLAVFLASAMIVNAQFEKGSFMVGVTSAINLVGSGTGTGLMTWGFSNVTETYEYIDYAEENKSETRHLNFQPRAGYFFIDNMAAGAGFNFAKGTTKVDSDGEYKYSTTIVAFAPFYRYYLPLDKVTPFFEANAAIGSLTDKSQYENDDPIKYKHSLFSFGAGAGASFPIGMNASFDVMAGYTMLKTKWEEGEELETSKVGTLGLEFGFKVYFGGYGLGSADASY
jgi:hypothetical protein